MTERVALNQYESMVGPDQEPNPQFFESDPTNRNEKLVSFTSETEMEKWITTQLGFKLA
ncbi:uncharacterized protein G2W53_005467 [Senna tora]|uniref:Uncharacterized protein n=1 Tax=Senna tora TaxID=362788 RepID=A0A835CDR0_9FABA|nr:uncharacterized protein G2W53_005467 [Senna tora]